jgi:hypothetical protein
LYLPVWALQLGPISVQFEIGWCTHSRSVKCVCTHTRSTTTKFSTACRDPWYGRDTRVPRYYSCIILMCTKFSSDKLSTSRSIWILNLMCENRVNMILEQGLGHSRWYSFACTLVLIFIRKRANKYLCYLYIQIWAFNLFLVCMI